jgi:hypothetical protein
MVTLEPETLLRWLFAEAAPNIESATWVGLEPVLEALHLSPLVYTVVRRRGAQSAIPAELLSRMAARYHQQVALNLEIAKAGEDIARAAAAAGFPLRLLKGGHLFATGLYDDIGERYTQDVDVLVRPRDRSMARRALLALGYQERKTGAGPKHDAPFVRGRLSVEVHDWAYWDRGGNRIGLERMAERDALEHTALHLVHHLFFTSPFEHWLLIRTLRDIDHLFRSRRLGGSRLGELARAANLHAELDGLRALLSELEGARPLGSRSRAIIERAGALSRSEANVGIHFYADVLRNTPAWFARDTLISVLLPDRATLAQIYGRSERSRLLPAYYLIRPFHLGYRTLSTLVRRRLR